MIDQRHATRIAVDLPARCRLESSSIDGRATNISRAGMLFVARTSPTLELPASVKIQIDLPDHEAPLEVLGEIRWIVAPTLMGIRFTQVSLIGRRRLANYLIRRSYAVPR